MLSVYTRHCPPCAQSDPYYRRCHCPKWIMGTVETTGAFVRVSARTRAWEKAEKKARLMDAEAADPSPARVTVDDALDAFIARKQGQRLSHSWLYKFFVDARLFQATTSNGAGDEPRRGSTGHRAFVGGDQSFNRVGVISRRQGNKTRRSSVTGKRCDKLSPLENRPGYPDDAAGSGPKNDGLLRL
jgi:hypothetical protein